MRSILQYLLIPILFVVLLIGTSQHTYGQDTLQVRKTEVFPNPFRTSLTIIPHKRPADIQEITIYDPIGNLVFSFSQEMWQKREIQWNGTSSSGGSIARGTYIFLIRTKDKSESLILQKL